MIPENHFSKEYYERYYHEKSTSVVTPEMKRNEVAFVIAFCRHIGLKIERFADVGAGTGWWAREFRKRYATCDVIETFDASEAACEEYGHRHMPLQRLAGPASDLVVCRDVLRYISNAEVNEAIDRLAKRCRGVLYLHVITSDDEIDEEASDMTGWFRTTAWYRKALAKAGFRDCGMGLFVSRRFKAFDPFKIEVR